MIAYTLAIIGLVMFVQQPAIGGALFMVGLLMARRHTPDRGDIMEMLVFYGAILGVGVAFMNW